MIGDESYLKVSVCALVYFVGHNENLEIKSQSLLSSYKFFINKR